MSNSIRRVALSIEEAKSYVSGLKLLGCKIRRIEAHGTWLHNRELVFAHGNRVVGLGNKYVKAIIDGCELKMRPQGHDKYINSDAYLIVHAEYENEYPK